MARANRSGALLLLFAGLWTGGLRHPAIWTVAAIALWSAALIEPPRFSKLPAARLWLCWLAWSLLSAVLSSEPLRSLAAFAHASTAFLFYAQASQWDASERWRWCRLLIVSGAVLGAATLYEFDPSYPHVGLLHPYYNYTVCVEAMAFAAGLAALGAGRPKASAGRVTLGLGMIAMLVLMSLARSRGGLLACAVSAAIWMARTRRWESLARYGTVALIAAAVSFRLWSPLLKFDRPGAYVRPAIWRAAVSVAGDHPIFGEGPGLFERGFQRHNFPVFDRRLASSYGMRTAHAHSELLQAAAETGWPGFVLLFAALCAAFSAAWRGNSGGARRVEHGDTAWVREAGLLAAAAAMTQASVDNIFNLPSLHWLFFSALAAAQVEHEPADRPKPRLWPAVAAGLSLAALAWVPDWLVQRWDRQALDSLDAAQAQAALKIAPGDPGLWEDLARIYLRRRPPERDRAVEAIGRAFRLDPTNASYPLMLAELHASEGRWNGARDLAERALELEPEFLEAHLVRAEAQCRLGNRAAAQAEVRMIETIRRDQVARFGDAGVRGPLVLRLDEARLAAVQQAVKEGCKKKH